MRRPVRRVSRPRIRAELDATSVPIWQAPRVYSADAASLAFMRAPGRLPHGRRVYAIGDIHGCCEQLRQLHAAIADDLAAHRPASAILLHLGDMIDCGPDSAGVVALLAAGSPIAGLPTINLMGDHERTALDALSGDNAAATDWLHMGGAAALESWGIAVDTPRGEWRAIVPTAHIDFLRGVALEHREGNYLFVHAGIRPGFRLTEQTEEDLLGIRQSFLASEADFGAVVVHGHSASPAPIVRPNRIGIDTGAGFGGKLTCAVLEDDRIAFMSA